MRHIEYSLICSPVNWAPVKEELLPDELHKYHLETDLQQFLLRKQVPFLLDGITYMPICAEAPAKDGCIDLVYVSDKGTMLLAEVKISKKQTPLSHRTVAEACDEHLNHIIKFNDAFFKKTLTYLKDYRSNKKRIGNFWKVPVGAYELFTRWCHEHEISDHTSIKDLFCQDRLKLALIANVMPAQSEAPPFPHIAYCSVETDKFYEHARIKVIESNGSSSEEVWKTWMDGPFKKHEEKLKKAQKNSVK